MKNLTCAPKETEIEKLKILIEKSKHYSELLKEQRAKLVSEGYYTNQNVPIDQRLELFFLSKNEDCYVRHLPKTTAALKEAGYREICWYDDFHVDRYQKVCYDNLLNTIHEYIDSGIVYRDNSVLTAFIKNPEILNIMKEEILEQGYTGFENDW
jgi:hypothetical protein